MLQGGAFVISLDFELLWGVRDTRTIADYGANILGVRKAVPAMLDLFASRGIGCTWATVGFLFCADRDELLGSLPPLRPRYRNSRLSPYDDMATLGPNEESDPYHFGLSLLRQVQRTPRQEIGTHTFSHFYCLEEGGTVDAFRADMLAAVEIARRRDVALRSLALPRNQLSAPHLRVCRAAGVTSFRGNERIWFHKAAPGEGQSLPMRAARLIDTYLPVGGAHVYRPELVEGMLDIPSSRFLRPVRGPRRLEKLRLQRIGAAMAEAARRDAVFHLWWHPHNFGTDLQANLDFLSAVLDYFGEMRRRHGMRAMTMADVVQEMNHAGSRPSHR